MSTRYDVVAVIWVSANMPPMMSTSPKGTIRPDRAACRERAGDRHGEHGAEALRRHQQPASSVDSPRTCWKYVGTSSRPPKNAAANRNIVMIETVRLRFRNSRRSSSGCLGRKVQNTKAATMSSPMGRG